MVKTITTTVFCHGGSYALEYILTLKIIRFPQVVSHADDYD
jgi:hypothetical protein